MLKETEEYKNINKNCKKIIIDDLLRIYNYIFNNYLKNPQEEKQEGQAKRTREMHESEQDRRVRGRIGSGSGSKNN
uniref:Uncharacterized protein n=1 Tax=Meloidogyne hapla TaxID=6305 RepID=A0A1I8BIL5_MELHA